MRERQYHESEWAVQLWDWFHYGRIVEPRSFCQFWRTVLVYAPLAHIFGFLRVKELSFQEKWERQYERQERQEKKPSRLLSAFEWLVSVLGRIVRLVFSPLLMAIVWVDDSPKAQNVLRAILIFIMVAVITIGLGFWAYIILFKFIPWLLSLPWANLLLVVGSTILIGLAGSLALVYVIIPRLVWPFLKLLGSAFKLAWDIAVTAKKQVCPPMQIVRN